MRILSSPKKLSLGLASILLFSSAAVVANQLDSALEKGVQRSAKAQKAQQQIDRIDGQIRSIERDYRNVIKEVEGLEVYNTQLDKQLDSQLKEMQQIRDSIGQVTLIERQITPLMLKMIDALGQFVALDVPFLAEERKERAEKLHTLIGRSDVTVAEKFRKVMEAYQAEVDYGRTIQSYRGSITLDGAEKEVDFLRVGRVSFLYQSLDGQNTGAWNTKTKQWEILPSEYKSKVLQGVRIAREQAAPDLIKVVVSAPEAK